MGKASDIYIENTYAGFLGVMGPDIIEKLDLKKQKPEVVLFELNLDLLFSRIPCSIQYTQITKYPSVERDVAMVVDETIPSARIMEIIREFPTELIGDVSVFDFYKGGAIPSGKKSLGFNIIFRSKERTLRDDEVEELHASLVSHIIQKTGGELR
jgi:phenylalanyl-tRNA synthetase beta chain